eukprot:3014664-Rhodomonas_salina.1
MIVPSSFSILNSVLSALTGSKPYSTIQVDSVRQNRNAESRVLYCRQLSCVALRRFISFRNFDKDILVIDRTRHERALDVELHQLEPALCCHRDQCSNGVEA